MTNETILRKAIFKVVENGWEEGTFKLAQLRVLKGDEIDRFISYIIFSHSFAKAFGKYIIESKQTEKVNWIVGRHEITMHDNKLQHYIEKNLLLNMVLSEDPIQYLKKFL